ncbi:MAG: dTDP-glucose 4,6-dehydratase [Clostridiales bacterium]|nr:dTDP-glucose 4,6-dehydratase [Clostridiales bacterium]
MKTYLVTGGAGFIGSNFVIYMLSKYNDVRIVNVDALTYAGNLENLVSVENHPNYRFVQANICDAEAISKIFEEETIDYVVNFAAESHVDRSISDPEIFVKTNVLGTVNLLNLAKKAWQTGNDTYRDGCKFLQVSTDEVYGSLGADGFFTEKTPLDPHSPYSSSKASADLFVKAYADTYKFPVNITRCSNNYGPYQFPEKLIPLMINNTLSHKSLPVYGDGMQIRDWLYVEDHCKAIDMVIRGGRSGEVYNVGGHNERPNVFIVHTILDYIKEHVDHEVGEQMIKHVEDRKGHDRRYGIDPEKIKNELGWYPETPFEKGIVKTIEWYLSHKEWMENVTSGDYQKYYDKMYANR